MRVVSHSSTVRERGSGHIGLWILIAIVLAVAMALVAPRFSVHLKIGGDVFLNLLKMIVVPLVITSVMSGVIGLGDVRRLGRPGAATIGFFFFTTMLAVIIGLMVVNVVDPGVGLDGRALSAETGEAVHAKATAPERPQTTGELLRGMVLLLFTDNLFRSAVEVQLLPLIVFSILFAAILTMRGAKSAPLASLITQVNDALMDFVMLLMRVAPLGIFCLVAARFGLANAEGQLMTELKSVGKYFGAVLIGLALHGLIVLPAIYWVFTRKNPFRFLGKMSRSLLTAFSTASSSATLPVTMECAIDEAGISRKSVEFVVPLGSTVNMNGTALYEAVAALFIAQAFGIQLDFAGQVIVAITATLAAIGAAGIPEAGLITMVIVLNAAKLPVEGMALILSVDWLLDRFRTAINVLGDVVGAAVVEPTMPADDKAPGAA
ncbi:MAG: dicarboxylate/amino acid:cation symporter [Verrucomicrobiales bacterium]|nr:dicarboxylate/amino acid:cation symporter [Verrucomicrobiales bacterium]